MFYDDNLIIGRVPKKIKNRTKEKRISRNQEIKGSVTEWFQRYKKYRARIPRIKRANTRNYESNY